MASRLLAASLLAAQARMSLSHALCPAEEAMPSRRQADVDTTLHSGGRSLMQIGRLTRSSVLSPHSNCDDLGSPPVLAGKVDDIFGPFGSRNAGSHLWVHYILKRAGSCYTHSEIEDLFSQFCPVSGSPLRTGGMTIEYDALSMIGGGTASGIAHHCCWPCACDTTDLLRVDTKNVTDKTGSTRQYRFLVIGDPCVNNPPVCQSSDEKDCIPADSPAVVCETTTDDSGSMTHQLMDAERSDHNHPILGMLFSSLGVTPDYEYSETLKTPEGLKTMSEMCRERQAKGYNSGMMAVFQDVGHLNPLS